MTTLQNLSIIFRQIIRPSIIDRFRDLDLRIEQRCRSLFEEVSRLRRPASPEYLEGAISWGMFRGGRALAIALPLGGSYLR